MNKYNIIKLNDVASTNTYALSLKSEEIFKEGLVFVADYQYQGRGQRGSFWESEVGKNLIISVVIEPNLPIGRKFDITKIVAVALTDLLLAIGFKAQIKWPNDILIGDRKIAGILIDNIISRGVVTHSVIGIGLNVNQVVFNDYSPKATSFRIEADKTFSLEIVRDRLLNNIQKRIASYRLDNDLDGEYLSMLFQKDMVSKFESGSRRFIGVIRGVNDQGLIIIESENVARTFDLKQVRMIL